MPDAPERANRPALSLHVPEPPGRPGDAPDFSHVQVLPAGATPRPDSATPARAMADMVYGLVRVLNDAGDAVGPWNPRLSPETLLAMLRVMVTTRVYDDRMFRAQRQGKTSFYIKSTGEEAVAVGAAFAMQPDDMCFPIYRQQGLLIARGYPLRLMMNQVYSNRGDPLHGRQLPIMYSSKEFHWFSISGNLGTQVPQAVGWAMASAIKNDSRIAATWTGEGATAEGDFHHACTFASVYRAPVILNVVNNQWAISSFQGIAGGEQTTFAARALGYGIAGLRIDGNDILAVHAATAWAADRARANLGPTIIEHFTYRAESHSTSDDPGAYRPAKEGEAWPLGDPIERLKRHLIRLGAWDEERHAALQAETIDVVRAVQREAEKLGTLGDQTFHDIGTMFEDVYEQMPWHLAEQRAQSAAEVEAARS